MKSKECIEPRIDSPLTLKEFKELNAGIEIDGKMSHQIVDQVDTKSLFSFTACWFISPCQEACLRKLGTRYLL